MAKLKPLNPTIMNIHLIIGSQMGAAEYVADELAIALESLGHQPITHEKPDINVIPTQSKDPLREDIYWLICTSTHAAGELPDNIQPFINALKVNNPSLIAIKYGIIGLGDTSYDTYCQAAVDIDQLLLSLGAQQRGSFLQINALDEDLPEEYALNWLPIWLDSLIK